MYHYISIYAIGQSTCYGNPTLYHNLITTEKTTIHLCGCRSYYQNHRFFLFIYFFFLSKKYIYIKLLFEIVLEKIIFEKSFIFYYYYNFYSRKVKRKTFLLFYQTGNVFYPTFLHNYTTHFSYGVRLIPLHVIEIV
jgi:hypothetical protein